MENEFDNILSYLETQEKIINEKGGSHRNVEAPFKSKKIEKIEKLDKKIIKPKTNINISMPCENEKVISNSGVRGFDSDKFVSLMRSELIKNNKRYKSFRSKEYLSVTELYICPRQVYYSRKNFPENKYIYPNLLMIQDVGKAVHKIIQKIYPFEKCEDTIKSEKYKAKGKFDGFVDNSIIEIKTFDRNKYKGTYLLEHYYQGSIYAYILNNEYGYKIDNISIVYIIRDLKDKKPPVFNLKPNNFIAEKFLNRSLLIHRCLDINTPPPIIIKSVKDCQWCPFKKQCKKDGDSDKIIIPNNNNTKTTNIKKNNNTKTTNIKKNNNTKTKNIKKNNNTNNKPVKSKEFEPKFLL